AVTTDKIILQKEGVVNIYPTYITDAIYALNKLIFTSDEKLVHFIVSENAKSALSCAYEIQKAAIEYAHKKLDLYFAGPQTISEPQPEPVVKIHNLGFHPKVDLHQGLNEIFTYFLKKNQVASAPRPITQPATPIAISDAPLIKE